MTEDSEMKKVFIVIMALCFALSGLSGVANAREIWFEAEWPATMAGPMEVRSTNPAGATGTPSNGEYILRNDGSGDSNGNPAGGGDNVWTYYFFAPAGGPYKIVWRTFVGSNSFWIKVHDVDTAQDNRGDGWIRNNDIPGGGWDWHDVFNDNMSGDPRYEFTLRHSGLQTVQISHREDGTLLDGFVITDDLSLDPATLPDVIPAVPNLLWKAQNPSPANGAMGVELTGTTLTWEAPTSPPEAITRYDVYFGDIWMVGDPNEGNTYLVASVAGDGTLELDLDAAVGSLTNDLTYFWRVDAVIVAEPNSGVATGNLWSFDSVKYKPIITAQPANARVWAGETAVFAVEAISGEFDDRDALSYRWHNSGGEIAGETSSELVIANAQDANADDYYCVVSNGDGDRVSAAVKLIIKHLLGHWPFDDDPNDVSGNGWLLTASGNPQFVGTGVINGAASLDGSGDFFSSAAFANSLNGNDALSVSMWIKSNVIGTDRGFLAFADPSGNDQRGIRYDNAGASSGGDDVIKYGVAGSNGEQQELETPSNMQVTEWQHIVLTWVGTGEDIKFYINARVIPPQSSDGQATGGLDGYTNMHIGRGGKDEDVATTGWDGLIDDVRIYDFPLDTLEIAVLYTDVMTDDSICLGGDPLDLDGDCRIGVSDLALFVAEYLDCNIVPDCKP